jgi:hypothetical protein
MSRRVLSGLSLQSLRLGLTVEIHLPLASVLYEAFPRDHSQAQSFGYGHRVHIEVGLRSYQQKSSITLLAAYLIVRQVERVVRYVWSSTLSVTTRRCCIGRAEKG